MKLKIQSLKNYFKSKKDRGLKPIFFEKIGDSNTSREQRLKNLIKVLKSQGFKIKNKKKSIIFDLKLRAVTNLILILE